MFEIVKALYKKDKREIDKTEIDLGLCIAMNRWLILDSSLASLLEKISDYLMYIMPRHYLYLLFFNIPKKATLPFFNFKKKESEKDESKLMEKIRSVLKWSRREAFLNSRILESTILTNSKYWKTQLGVA